jgi:glutamate 5-kinase
MEEEHKWEAERGKRLRAARRLVIKLGTNTVTGPEGDLCADRVEPLVRSIARLKQSGRQVVLVSSGAVGLGRGWLGLHRSRLSDMVTKQACAAVGQSLLMDAYKRFFSTWEVKIAQVLLTEEDFTVWRRYSNLRHTIEKLLQFGVIPVINENDTVSTAELAAIGVDSRAAPFSDNDRLAALVMSGLEADALVLLTNVDGFLRNDFSRASVPAEDSPAEVIPLIEEITPELRALASGPSASGRGGMPTKLDAAEIAMICGGIAVIANGQAPGILERIFAGEAVGTTFLPSKRMRGKRRWIAFAADVQGRIVVDAGAHRALAQGKASLLASGVVRMEGHFAQKDVVSIVDREGREFARGIADCDNQEAADLVGKKGAGAGKGRGAGASRILVRRDNIVLLQK